MDFLPPTLRNSAGKVAAFSQRDKAQIATTRTSVHRGIGIVAAACVVVLVCAAERAGGVTLEAFNYIGVPGNTNNNQASLSNNEPSSIYVFHQALTRYTPTEDVKARQLNAVLFGQDAFFVGSSVQYGGELDFSTVDSWTIDIFDHNPGPGGGQNGGTLNGNVFSGDVPINADFNAPFGSTFSSSQNTYFVQGLIDGNIAPTLQGGIEYWITLRANLDGLFDGRVGILISDLGIGLPPDVRTSTSNGFNWAFIDTLTIPEKDKFAYQLFVEPLIQPPTNAALPEPGTAVLLICGGMPMALRRRGCRPVGA